MKIEPPTVSPQPNTANLRHRLGYMVTIVIGVGVILVVTIAAWLLLWGGGMQEAAETEEAPPATAPP
jgi:hypothetical protein